MKFTSAAVALAFAVLAAPSADASPIYHLARRDNNYGARTDVLIQAFHWNSWQTAPWYNTIATNAPQLKGLFTLAWFPPPSDAGSNEGYLPRRWNVLTSKYGTADQLKAAVQAVKANGLQAVADIVINHRVGSTKWNDYTEPAFADNNAATTSDDEVWKQPGYGTPTGHPDTGLPYTAGRDLDFTNPSVQDTVTAWMTNTLKAVGFTGWRYDFVRGYAPSYVGQFNAKTSPVFSVGELWADLDVNNPSAHRNQLLDWVKGTGSNSAAFDFTTKGMLNQAVASNNYAILAQNNAPVGLIGTAPGYAVTFVDNHDTGASPGGTGGQKLWQFPVGAEMQGYAYILTHPGIPSVYWPHYFDQKMKAAIDPLLKARKAAGVNSLSHIRIDKAANNVYAAYIAGTVGSLAVKLGPADWTPSCPGSAGAYKPVGSGTNWAVWSSV
ncbi:uncharacterized protein EV422DRAFT_282022 [Fimicolochytrium jonesii]|uniref:uncharacterized protein n=1 Tax=Fimicolochytrium jonesii TaxID=1396493 RepID=UPI0022FEA6D3|nr:uncharacterized protein EV422DRAFT_282022 [Fimicolochytrium jonesii]KAI8816641.1 hypothetical protein EV422DRAFT_282022 [Fimicolochytrium jonesii]